MINGAFEIKESPSGFWFKLAAANGETLLVSEQYKTKKRAEQAIYAVRSELLKGAKFTTRKSKDGRFYFNLEDSEGKLLGSSQMYASQNSAQRGIEQVIAASTTRQIRDHTEKKAEHIGSVRTFLQALEGIEVDIDHVIFYRGHDNSSFKLTPGIYRNTGWLRNENTMFHELKIKCPFDFLSATSVFEALVKMQHYSLPTRLLDLTMNPLVALYFACLGDEQDDGEVVVIKIPKSEIKYSDSDTVSVLSNITLMQDGYTPSNSAERGKLIREVQREKPYFENKIKTSDLNKVVCVKPALNNPRIIKQEGAFLLFGINQNKTQQASLPGKHIALSRGNRLIIKASDKSKIMQQINSLGISTSSIFPEIDSVADHIKAIHKD